MITSVAIAAVIACLVTTLIFTVRGNIRLQKEADLSNAELYRVRTELDHLQVMYIESIQTSAWLRGLRIGTEPKIKVPDLEDLRVKCDIKEDKQI